MIKAILLVFLLLNPAVYAEDDDEPDVFFDGTKTVHSEDKY